MGDDASQPADLRRQESRTYFPGWTKLATTLALFPGMVVRSDRAGELYTGFVIDLQHGIELLNLSRNETDEFTKQALLQGATALAHAAFEEYLRGALNTIINRPRSDHEREEFGRRSFGGVRQITRALDRLGLGEEQELKQWAQVLHKFMLKRHRVSHRTGKTGEPGRLQAAREQLVPDVVETHMAITLEFVGRTNALLAQKYPFLAEQSINEPIVPRTDQD